jgi:sodium-dependent dicarboxylate transporter 2/3/5
MARARGFSVGVRNSEVEVKKKGRLLKFLVITAIAIAVYFIPMNVGVEAHIVLSLLVFAALMWITETFPLYLTAIIVSFLLVFLGIIPMTDAAARFADPIIILFFAGFMIARAMQSHGLDRRFAWFISSRTENSKLLLLIVMFATAFLSMWISNTASTAIMIPIALGIVMKSGSRMTSFTKSMVLGVAFAANIGGMGTIIGSPPNAITVSNLQTLAGIEVSFFGWMIQALPVVIVLIPVAWFILTLIYPPERGHIKHKTHGMGALGFDQKLFMAIFIGTVALWFTTQIHGMSSSLVGVLSVIVLFAVGLLKKSDLGKINWDILILFGGGLVLGSAMFSTGLSAYFADILAGNLLGLPSVVIILALASFSIVLGALASNTVTAAIVVPVVLPLASILGLSPQTIAMVCGLAVSLDFLLPVGTPPNAMAYATGKITVPEMLKAGILITVISVLVLTLFASMW